MKKKIRFNIFDLLIIVVIAAIVSSFVYRDELVNLVDKSPKCNIECEFSVSELSLEAAEMLSSDVVFKYSGETFGKVVDCSFMPAKVLIESIDGNLKSVVMPDKYDVSGSFNATASQRENDMLFIGDLMLGAGRVIRLETDTAVYDVLILSIKIL